MPADPTPTRSDLGSATRPGTKRPDWHGLVAWDLFFNGLATGLFLVAALGELGVALRGRRPASASCCWGVWRSAL